MGVSGGGIGFDEGGVLQALSRPMGEQDVQRFKYNKKGLVIEHTTTHIAVSMADLLAVLIAAGLITYGPEVTDEIKNNPEIALNAFGIVGMIAAAAIKKGKTML